MSDRKNIEALLDQALQKQVQAPRLDPRFNAAVWARIEKEAVTARAAAVPESRARQGVRWLAVSNVLGVAATLAVAAWFALRAFGGVVAPALDLGVALPTVSEETVLRTTTILGQALGYAALVFGLSFTSLGRRLRASFS
jgi:hypothetical protein